MICSHANPDFKHILTASFVELCKFQKARFKSISCLTLGIIYVLLGPSDSIAFATGGVIPEGYDPFLQLWLIHQGTPLDLFVVTVTFHPPRACLNHCTADAAGLVFAGLFFGVGRAPRRWQRVRKATSMVQAQFTLAP
jgi:hypothetical protein